MRRFTLDRFLLMTCFARAVETGSFSAAGRDLGLGQPNVSRYVAALEDHLQTRLLYRSTRKLALTPEGERYYAEVRRILDAVDESESSLRDNVDPSGLLRVACPTALAHTFVVPLVPAFLERYPSLALDLQINDRYVNLVDEGAQLAIRIGHLEDSALRARRVGLFERVFVASKAYLAKRSIPGRPTICVSTIAWSISYCHPVQRGILRMPKFRFLAGFGSIRRKQRAKLSSRGWE
jgi:DNA-binding transcriptional LysR family regulator